MTSNGLYWKWQILCLIKAEERVVVRAYMAWIAKVNEEELGDSSSV